MKNIKQFIKFCMVGVVSTAIDVGMFALLTKVAGVHYLISNVISFLTSLVNSYALNRKFTFRNKHKKIGRQFSKYLTVYTIGLGLSEIILFALVEKFDLEEIQAKLAAVGVVLFWNYFASKIFIFDRDARKDSQAG